MSSEHNPDNDQQLLDLLRHSLGALAEDRLPLDDLPPDSVLDGARWLHDWHNMESELALLTFDSTQGIELAGVRSNGALRELTFVTDTYTIELEIEPGPRTTTVYGAIEPPVSGKMQLLVAGHVFGSEIDRDGSFEISEVASGTVLAFVEVPAGKIRLGSFEL